MTKRVSEFDSGHRSSLNSSATERPQIEPVYSVNDLMMWSGESEATWRKRFQRKELAIVKFGSNTRVEKSALDRWLRERNK